MNKRISTMFASFLLMAGVAFAADGTTYSQKEAKPTEGLKVYLGNEEGTSFLKSAKVTDAAYKFANTVTESEAGVFTVTGDVRINQSVTKEKILESLDFYRESFGI